MARTHAAFGLLCALCALFFISFFSKDMIIPVVAVIFALVPDIDTPKSFVGRRLGPISYVINFLFGHRRLFHAVWLPTLLFVVFARFNLSVAIGIAIGYLSHLVLDLSNDRGIQPLYPLRFHISGPFKTGGFFEVLIFIVIVSSDFLILLRIFG
ncbi:MAG: metal-dependent hydrolase [Candidatus Woesearchaeota archaeon]